MTRRQTIKAAICAAMAMVTGKSVAAEPTKALPVFRHSVRSVVWRGVATIMVPYCDGTRLNGCCEVFAGDKGWAICFRTDANGKRLRNPDNSLMRQVVYGRIELRTSDGQLIYGFDAVGPVIDPRPEAAGRKRELKKWETVERRYWVDGLTANEDAAALLAEAVSAMPIAEANWSASI